MEGWAHRHVLRGVCVCILTIERRARHAADPSRERLHRRDVKYAPSAGHGGGVGVRVCASSLTLVAAGDDGEEAVVADLDAVDVEHALGRGDEAEVDRVREGPHLPAAGHLSTRGAREEGEAQP